MCNAVMTEMVIDRSGYSEMNRLLANTPNTKKPEIILMSKGRVLHICVESIPLRLAHKMINISQMTKGASNRRDHSTHGICMLCIYVGYAIAEMIGMMMPITMPKYWAAEKRGRISPDLRVKCWAKFSISQGYANMVNNLLLGICGCSVSVDCLIDKGRWDFDKM